MADNYFLRDHYLETESRGSKDKCIETPLPIARDVKCINISIKPFVPDIESITL